MSITVPGIDLRAENTDTKTKHGYEDDS